MNLTTILEKTVSSGWFSEEYLLYVISRAGDFQTLTLFRCKRKFKCFIFASFNKFLLLIVDKNELETAQQYLQQASVQNLVRYLTFASDRYLIELSIL